MFDRNSLESPFNFPIFFAIFRIQFIGLRTISVTCKVRRTFDSIDRIQTHFENGILFNFCVTIRGTKSVGRHSDNALKHQPETQVFHA